MGKPFAAPVANARSNDRGLWAYDGVDGSKLSGTTGKLVIEKVIMQLKL